MPPILSVSFLACSFADAPAARRAFFRDIMDAVLRRDADPAVRLLLDVSGNAESTAAWKLTASRDAEQSSAKPAEP